VIHGTRPVFARYLIYITATRTKPNQMTIHTQWMSILRENAVDAFHTSLPETAQASFIDGQIKLMKGDSIQTWSHFLYSQFTSVIMRHFLEFGCKTVVLAFDDKRFVPKAKAITQLKRRANVQIIDFTEHDMLPNDVPLEWKEAIMNANFKNRVVEYVCVNIPRLIDPPPNCTLIVDFQTVTRYDYGDRTQDPVVTEEETTEIGEADIKVTHWMQELQLPMLIDATDGDYIPIALGLKTAGYDQPISILKGHKADVLEFISINALHAFLCKSFHRAARGRDLGPHWETKLFITLLGLAGTDFSRNLPLVSPAKMWAALPLVVQTFAMDGATTLDAKRSKRLVELLYAETFPKHIDAYERSMSIWHQAQLSKLGVRNKGLIPTDARIRCTIRNLNFLMAYWLDFQAPSNIEAYGFRYGSTGTIEWDD